MNDVDSFRIDVPASWRQLPLDLPSLQAGLDDRDEESWSRLDPLERRRIELYFLRLLADVESVNARFVAVYSEVPEVEAEAPEETPLVAACIVSLLDRQVMGSSDLPLSPAVIQAAMSMTSRENDRSPLAGFRSTNLREPTIVVLPNASAVLLQQLVEFKSSKEVTSMATETYFVPIADKFEQVVVVQFSTPNLQDASIFSELFAEIAATITFYREGEETIL